MLLLCIDDAFLSAIADPLIMSLRHMKRRLASVWSNYSGPDTPPSSDCGCDHDDDQMETAAITAAADTTTTTVLPRIAEEEQVRKNSVTLRPCDIANCTLTAYY